ncbi:MFS transporter [Rhizobium changzhiense]|uniref:MFS transporter n=1 Tax=Rhizobium changzhiense TaxID=2692317 RepID=UPI001F0C8DF9|nr:MFS transporter [Rhizobium changzhiense]MCH4547470.1 MFS transporter [Rhizobium changzhiense]
MKLQEMLTHWSAAAPNIRTILTASFLFYGGQFATAYFSLYLSAGVGMSVTEIGFAVSLFGASGVIGAWLSDLAIGRLGYMKALVIGQAISGVILVVLAYLSDPVLFILVSCVLFVIRALYRPALTVCVNSECPTDSQNVVYAMFMSISSLGLAFATAVGGWLLTHHITYILIAESVFAALTGFFILAFSRAKSARSDTPGNVGRKFKVPTGMPELRFLLICVAAFLLELSTGQTSFAIPIYSVNELGFSPQTLGIVIAIIEILFFVTAVPLNSMFRRVKPLHVAVAATICVSLGQFLVPFGDTPLLAVLCRVPYIVGLTLAFPAIVVLATSGYDADAQLRNTSLFYSAIAAGELMAGIVGGWIYGSFSGAVLWNFSALAALICAFLLFFTNSFKSKLVSTEAR